MLEMCGLLGVTGPEQRRRAGGSSIRARYIVEFRVPTFWGLSTVVGHFDRFDGFYGRDSEDVLAIELAIDADSLDTDNGTRDRHLRAERFFNVHAHPQVRFTSTLVNDLDARRPEPNARAALAWIDEYGDSDGDGYVEYERRNTETGLENQCWKDSWNSILFADGTLARLPRATCELQGYVYDARRRCGRLAREIWDDNTLAQKLEHQADELKRSFNDDFWLEDRGYYALALDGDKQRVDALTSNIGHLLWSGIVDDDRAEEVVKQLLGPRLFSGWGVRTMAEGDGGYNPIGYHQGTVWPHDNSLIAAGLRRYGYHDEAATIAFAILEAAQYFLGRLPETFAGYERSLTDYPVEYPTACSPQAWATGAPLFLLRILLGLEARSGAIEQHAVLPQRIRELALHDLSGPAETYDASAARAHA